MGQLATGVAADEEHHIRLAENTIGALSRVISRGSDGQRMVGREHRLGVERGGDRNRQLLGQADQLLARVRSRHTAAGHDHRPTGAVQ